MLRQRKRPNRLANTLEALESRQMLTCDAGLCGDLNLDGHVDFSDFHALSANFGTEGELAQGDITGDGYVDFSDFLILSQNYGKSVNEGLVKVTWEKTLDPLAPGAVWVGPGTTSDGSDVTVRALDFQLGADGTTIERATFEIHGEGRETVSLRLSGTFTPGTEPGHGAIELVGEQDAKLNSETTNGVVTTAGVITYTNAAGETEEVEWEKTLDPFNPLAVWSGSGQTSDGQDVDIRALDFVLGADGTTIEKAIFEVLEDGHTTASMTMAGEFTPGSEPGTGSIFLVGEQGSTLRSTTTNGVVTTAGEITYTEETVSPENLTTINWEKTLDPLAPGAVWVGPGTTSGGEAVTVRALDFQLAADGTTIERATFEIHGEGRETVSLRLSGTFMPGAEPGHGSIELLGEQDAKLNSETTNGVVTTAGVITYTNAAGETEKIDWEKTLDPFNPLAVWSGQGQTPDGQAVDIRALDFTLAADGTTIEKATFEVWEGGDVVASMKMSGHFTPGSEPGTGSIFLVGEQGSTLRSTTTNGVVTTAGSIQFYE